MTPIEQIKQSIKIEDLIAETFQITGRGHILTTAEHDSLKIWTRTQTWHWFSQGAGGDALDWWQYIHRCDFRTALDELARRAGIELRQLTDSERQAAAAQRTDQAQRAEILRIAAAYHHAQLLASPDALAYCQDARGWTLETIKREQIGYCPAAAASTDNKPLSAQLRDADLADHPLARAVLSIPTGHLVYVHRNERAQPVYLSARSITAKRHYNLPEDLAGPKQPYYNAPLPPAGDDVILVEGQADAIALGQLGAHAVALCGLKSEIQTPISHVAYDNDKAGRQALEAALTKPESILDPLVHILTWPATVRHRIDGQNYIDVKDAADYASGATTLEDLQILLANSLTALELLAIHTSRAKDDQRQALLKRFFDLYTGLDAIQAADIKPDLANHLCAGSLAQFGRLLKAYEKQREASGEKPAGDKFEYSAGMARGGYVFEQCVIFKHSGEAIVTYAIRHPDGAIKFQNTVDIGGISYIPYPADMGLIDKRVVLFPERPEEYSTQKQLVADVQAFIHKYLDIDKFYEKLAAYYVLFSWIYDLFETLPYLRALGDYGTGKTRFIQTIGALCYRPMFVSGASTTSPIFRIIDMFSGTLIVDEADLAASDAQNDIIKIFNVGYDRRGVVLRSEKDPNSKYDEYWPVAKSVFGPKILASRYAFQDRATESRCLTKRTTTARPRAGIPIILVQEFWDEATRLRNRLLMYRLRNHKPVTIDPTLADAGVEPRLNQVTMALKAIVDSTEMRDEIDLFIRAYNAEIIQERNMTVEAIVLQVLVDIHYGAPDLLGERDFTLETIAKKAQEMIFTFDPDEKITAKRVGTIARDHFNLIPQRITARGEKRGRRQIVVTEEQLASLMARYGITRPDAEGAN